MEYLQILNNGELPDISKHSPFKCIAVIEQEVDPNWQAKVSSWLCSSGCRYMMAWGSNCSSWDDSVDLANITLFEGEEIPEKHFVITTWHEKEPLSEVFWYAKHAAHHESNELKNTVILHLSAVNKCQQLKSEHTNA